MRAYSLKQALADFRTEGNPTHKPAFTQLVLSIGEDVANVDGADGDDNKPGGNTEQPRRSTAKPGKKPGKTQTKPGMQPAKGNTKSAISKGIAEQSKELFDADDADETESEASDSDVGLALGAPGSSLSRLR